MARAAPTSPPTSAWLELDGIPRHQVITFQTTAPVSPAPTTVTSWPAGTLTIVAIVSATAAPRRSGPRRLQTAARTIACIGRATRVATSVAIAFEASWNPFVTANANAMAMASRNPVTVLLPTPGPRPADDSPGTGCVPCEGRV